MNHKTFRLHWLDGKKELVEGPDIATAMNNAGIGAGALPALDYWEECLSCKMGDKSKVHSMRDCPGYREDIF